MSSSAPIKVIVAAVALTGWLGLFGLDGGAWRVLRVVNGVVFALAVAWLLVALIRGRRKAAD